MKKYTNKQLLKIEEDAKKRKDSLPLISKKCDLPKEVKDAVSFINGIKLTLSVLAGLAAAGLLIYGVIKLHDHWHSSIYRQAVREHLSHVVRGIADCRWVDITSEEMKAIRENTEKDDATEFKLLRLNKTQECLSALNKEIESVLYNRNDEE